MNTKKFLIGGIVGGVVFFLLGYLIYGVLLQNFMKEHPGTATGFQKDMKEFQWWALVLGNLLSGFLLAYIFAKANIVSVANGLITGAIIGFLMSASHDSITYAVSNLMSKQGVVADVVGFTVLSAVAGAVIALVMGMGRAKTIPVT
jgi:hypothetical protein